MVWMSDKGRSGSIVARARRTARAIDGAIGRRLDRDPSQPRQRRRLRVRKVGGADRLGVLGETLETDLAHDAHDRVRTRVATINALADRILIGPEPCGQPLVQDRDAQRVAAIAFGKVPSAHKARGHGLEVARRHGDHGRDYGSVGARRPIGVSGNRRRTCEAAQRDVRRDARPLRHLEWRGRPRGSDRRA